MECKDGAKNVMLYINTSLLLGEKLYFTACNSYCLYSLDMIDGSIRTVTRLPCLTRNKAKFSSMVYDKGKLWMIPAEESDIMIYDMEKKTVDLLPLPFDIASGGKGAKFRKAIQTDNNLWLLPAFARVLIKINTDNLSCEIYEKWADESTFESDTKLNFKMMYKDNDEIYLFRDCCSTNLIVNVKSGEIRPWKQDTMKRFGVVKDGQVYLTPTYDYDKLYCFEVSDGKADSYEEELPDEVWKHAEFYAYWYAEVIGDFIYFLPFEAKALLVKNIVSGERYFVEVDGTEYCSHRKGADFSAYEAMPYRDCVLITSHQGNKVVLEKNGKIVREYVLGVSEHEMVESNKNEVLLLMTELAGKNKITWTKIISDKKSIPQEVQKKGLEDSEHSEHVGQRIYDALTKNLKNEK